MSTSQPDDLPVQLAAFLAGELDEDAADALQDRIDAEPWVARLADDMADTLVQLSAADRVEPPTGFGDRLRERLADEIGHPLPDSGRAHLDPSAAGAAAATGWAEQQRPSSRRPAAGPARTGRTARTRLRPALVAAVVVLLAVVGVGALTTAGFLSSSDDAGFADSEVALDAADSTRSAEGAQEESLEAAAPLAADESAAGSSTADATAVAPAEDGADTTAADSAADSAESAMTAPTDDGGAAEGPSTLTLGEVSADGDADVLQLLGQVPAVERLIGRPQADAAELSLVFRDEILRGPAFEDGTPAGRCLLDVLEQSGEDPVPAVAARLDLPEGPTVAYSLVRSRDGEVLDTVDVWLLDVADCMLRRVVSGG